MTYIYVFNLKPEHIVEVAKGEFWIKTTRQKTNTLVKGSIIAKGIGYYRKIMLIFTVMEFDQPDTRERFIQYVTKVYPDRLADELLERALKWIDLI